MYRDLKGFYEQLMNFATFLIVLISVGGASYWFVTSGDAAAIFLNDPPVAAPVDPAPSDAVTPDLPGFAAHPGAVAAVLIAIVGLVLMVLTVRWMLGFTRAEQMARTARATGEDLTAAAGGTWRDPAGSIPYPKPEPIPSMPLIDLDLPKIENAQDHVLPATILPPLPGPTTQETDR